MLPSESHDEFLELCALSPTNLLSEAERRRLKEHLRDCPSCREAYAQYQALVDADIPAAVAGEECDRDAGRISDWSMDEAEVALFARLDREDAETGRTPAERPASSGHIPGDVRHEPVDALWRQMWWQYAAAILLVVALGFSIYRSGVQRGAKLATASLPSVRPAIAPETEKFDAAEDHASAGAVSVSIAAHNAQLASLRAQLGRRAAEVARLQDENTILEQNLRTSQSGREQLRQNADELNRQLAASEADLAAARQRLTALGDQDSQDAVRLAAMEQQIDDLKTDIGQKDQEIAREQELLDHDRDIRELMGSRNLYIAEVYDVAKTGQTQRPFGRVFYTRGKSLIFYAYDLDQQPGIRNSSTFQAWGRRGPDEAHAVNLGIFYADNAAKKRWVLKAENPKTLSDIDAVFVTVEPRGGSSRPSGKPLLFAYLRIEPNHP